MEHFDANRKRSETMNRRISTVASVWTAATALAGLLATVALGSGCAQSQPDVNRVQPDFTKKSWLLGEDGAKEWYFRITVAGAPSLSAQLGPISGLTTEPPKSYATFPGAQTFTERGIFEIREDNLYFFRTYEWASGSEAPNLTSDVDEPLLDANGNPKTVERVINGEKVKVPIFVYRGAPVVSWPIMSHFDIKRSYNASTGEETNVLEENTQDRVWYEREYMRVDWASPSYGALDFPVSDVAPSITSSPFLATAPKSGGAGDEVPVFEWSGEPEQSELKYFDYTARAIFDVPTVPYPGFGEIPACWFFPSAFGAVLECASQEVKLRYSFLSVPKDDDYVPREFDDQDLERFGYFRAERPVWDPQRGVTYTGVSRRAMMHRIWKNYVTGADGQLDYSQMEPQPIVYYLSKDFPRELVADSIDIANKWSVPFEDVVEFYKGSKPPFHMFILCENNLEEACKALAEGLPTATIAGTADEVAQKCASVGYSVDASSLGDNPDGAYCDVQAAPKRIGDLRYNLLASINQPIEFGLYGFGPAAFDPLSGEIISANAFAYTGVMKRGAARAMDTIEMMAGIRTFLEIEDASYIKKALTAKRLRKTGTVSHYTPAQVQAMAANIMAPNVRHALLTQGLPKDTNFAAARLGVLKDDPEFERMLVGPSMRYLLRDPSLPAGQDPPDAALDVLSPRHWGVAAALKKRETRQKIAMFRTEFREEFADDAILGLVREYGARYDAAFCSQLEGKYQGVFDWDAFNQVGDVCEQEGAWNDAGWQCVRLDKELPGGPQLRWVNTCTTAKLVEQLSLAAEKYQGYNPNSAYDPGSPAYEDTEVEAFRDAIKEFRSILDGLREQFIPELWRMIYRGTEAHEVGHTLGLRHNFEASTDALNFPKEYWNLKLYKGSDGKYHPVNLWQRETKAQAYGKMRQLQISSVMEYTAKFNEREAGIGYYDRAAIRFGYGDLVEVFNQPPDMQALAPYEQEPENIDSVNPVLGPQSLAASKRLEAAFKKVHPTNYVKFFGDSIDRMYDRKVVRRSDVKQGDVEVPYRFCSDEFAGELPTCQVWDEGIDPFEIVINAADNYEAYWPFMGFSHESVTWDVDRYAYGVARYFFEMRRQFQYWVHLMLRYNQNDWWAKHIGNGLPWDQDLNGGLTFTLAAREGFNTLANAFGRPTEGQYGFNTFTERYEPISFLSNQQYTNLRWVLQQDGARPFYPGFDFSGYLYRPDTAGSIYDRIYAFVMLSDPTVTDLVFADEGENEARYQVNYFSTFPKQMIRLMGSLMASDEQNFGWWLCADNNGAIQGIARRDYFTNAPPEGCMQPSLPTDRAIHALNPEPYSVFPTSRFRIPILAAVYGMGFMIGNYDYSFLDVARLCLKGSGTCVDLAPGTDVAEFEDPLSGKVYMAARAGDSTVYDASYRLIELANQALDAFRDPNTGDINMDLLKNDYFYSDLQFIVGRLELVRDAYQKLNWAR